MCRRSLAPFASVSAVSMLLAGAFTLGVAPAAIAFDVNEGSDASNLRASARVLPRGTTTVNGEIANVLPDSDVDLYKIELVRAGPFTIEAIEIDLPLDMNLLVFNESGQGIAASDDNDDSDDECTEFSGMLNSSGDEFGQDSCLTLNLAAGVYYFAVGDNNVGAFSSVQGYQDGSDMGFDNDKGILDSPTDEIMLLVGDEGGPDELLHQMGSEGRYRVKFSRALDGPAALVPVPTLPLFGLGILVSLLGLFGLRKLRQ